MTGEPVRIGIVLHDFALGGTERIAVRLANAWSQMGADVEIFCGSDVGPLRDLLGTTIRVSAPPRPIARRWRSVHRLARAARAHFAAHPVTALFVPGNYHWPVARAIAALPRQVRPIVVAQVSNALEKSGRGGLRQIWFEGRMRRELGGADAIVTLAEETAIVARRILPGRTVTTIRLPALDDATAPPVEVPAGAPLLLAVGRLVAQKDFLNLVDAFAILAHPTARLAIAGSGPQEAAIRARIAAHSLSERVHLCGYVADVRGLLDRSRLVVLSSTHEGFPAVIIEALSAGRQVVATDCTPAARQLLGAPLTGRVVAIGDPAALAAAIAAVLAGPAPDPAALARHVDGFKIGPIARSYLDLMSAPAALQIK
ncbi:MAG: glycosyltransferase [Sphingomicrobium sp.]